MEFLTPPVVVAAIATAISTGFASFGGSWLVFRSKVREANSALAAKEAEVEADLRKHIDERLDAKWEAYTDRLERRLEKVELDATAKIAEMRKRLQKLEARNEELSRWAAAIRRDLWHVHRYLHAMRMAITEGNTDRADHLALRALAKLDDMLVESEGLVEESTPTIDEIP